MKGMNKINREKIENVRLDEERALYGSRCLLVKNVSFDGPADGESALKECSDIQVEGCFCNLRYPFWHVHGLKISDTEMTELCRAALWYSDGIELKNTKLHGIKALRECARVTMEDCDVRSPEFGWSTSGIVMTNTRVESEYFMMRATDLDFRNVKLKGKYSFQYIENALFDGCELDTKDSFWHGKNILVRNSVVKGEYLGWYSDGLTFENCTIIGTQPLCYCKNLKLIDCQLLDADLCFEKSEVDARLTAPVISIKNPYAGRIVLPAVGEIIRSDEKAIAEIVIEK